MKVSILVAEQDSAKSNYICIFYEETLDALAGVPLEGAGETFQAKLADAKTKVKQRLETILSGLTGTTGEE